MSHFIFIQWHSNGFQTNSNSIHVCVCSSRYNCTFVYVLLIFFYPFFSTRLYSLNCVYANTYLTKHIHETNSTASNIDDDTDATAADAADDDDNDFLFFYAKFSLSLLRAGEHMQSYHNIENLYWNICQHVYQILKSVKSFKRKRPLNECDMMMWIYAVVKIEE